MSNSQETNETNTNESLAPSEVPSEEVTTDSLSAILRFYKLERIKFFLKVYGTLFCQIAFDVLFCFLTLMDKRVNAFVKKHFWSGFVSVSLFAITTVLLMFCTRLSQNFPINLVCLFLIGVFSCWTLGLIAMSFDALPVVCSLIASAGIILISTLSVALSRCEMRSRFMTCLFIVVMTTVILCTAVVYAFYLKLEVFQPFFGCVATLCSSAYIFLVTLMVIKRFSFMPLEWIFAYLLLYTAIPTSFVHNLLTFDWIFF